MAKFAKVQKIDGKLCQIIDQINLGQIEKGNMLFERYQDFENWAISGVNIYR